MKRIILLLTFLSVAVYSSDVVFYDPLSSPVSNRVTSYRLSLNDVVYRDATNALIVTNRAAQSAAGVTATNLTLCVVDGQTIRLMTQDELDRIAATNALNQATSDAQVKYEAREYATNVIQGVGGQELFLRSLSEVTWFLCNQIRTNDGKPALTKGTFLQMIYTNINTFGQ